MGPASLIGEKGEKPRLFAGMPRHYRRFGLPRSLFQRFLRDAPRFDLALIGTGMTYWYTGVDEVIDEFRQSRPETTLVLGGNYPTLCPDHAATR